MAYYRDGLTVGRLVAIGVVALVLVFFFAFVKISENERLAHEELQQTVAKNMAKELQALSQSFQSLSEAFQKQSRASSSAEVIESVDGLKEKFDQLQKSLTQAEKSSLGSKLESIEKACTDSYKILQADSIYTPSPSEGGRVTQLVNRVVRPLPGRKVTVTPGALFGEQLAKEALNNEWMSLQRIDEDGVPFFAWRGQHSIGQDPIIDYLMKPGSDEERIRGLFKKIFRESARNKTIMDTNPFVLDIGANMGYYSLLTVGYGFPVISFEPQPHCHQFFKSAALLSGFSDKITLVEGLVGDEPDMEVPVEVRTGCWGTWPIGAQDVLSKIPDPPPPVVAGETGVDEMLNILFTQAGKEIPIIPLMKLDTEGYEFRVLRSAKELLKSKKVQNIIVELNSRHYHRSGSGPTDAKEMFEYLYGLGYRMQCIDTYFGFSQKEPATYETVLHRAETLKDPYSVDCWWYLV